MSHKKSYDEAIAARGDIELTIGDEVYTFPGEAPIDVAMEWFDRNTTTAEALGETKRVYAETNYAVVLGEDIYARLRETKVGQRTVDEMYRDLLDWWGLWPREKTANVRIGDLLSKLQAVVDVSLADTDRERIGPLVDELVTVIAARVAAGEEVTEGDSGND